MLTERELDMLTTLAMLRFMTTSQIHILHGYEGNYGLKVTRRKLQQLEQDGLVKSWQPSKYQQKVYYMSKLGAKTIEYLGASEEVRLYRKSDKSLHQTYVSEVYVRLKQEHQGNIRHFELNRKVGGVIPDAYIHFEFQGKPYYIFLEADTGSESLLYLRDVKLRKYYWTFKHEWNEPNGLHHHRIVILTLNESRKKSLIRYLEDSPLSLQVTTMDEFIADPLIIISDSTSPSAMKDEVGPTSFHH